MANFCHICGAYLAAPHKPVKEVFYLTVDEFYGDAHVWLTAHEGDPDIRTSRVEKVVLRNMAKGLQIIETQNTVYRQVPALGL